MLEKPDTQPADSLPRSFPGTSGLGIGGPGLMLFLKSQGYDLPTPIVWGVAIVSVIALAIAIFQVSSWAWHHLRRWGAHARANKLEPFYLQVIGLFGVIIFGVMALGGIIWQHNRSTSAIDKDVKNISGHATAEKPNRTISPFSWSFETTSDLYFIGLGGDSTGRVAVYSFQATGSNGTPDPIIKAGGYVRSDRTGKSYPINFVIAGTPYDPKVVDTIAVGSKIQVAAFFRDDRSPITSRELIDQIAPFTFFFEYDGKEYRSPPFSVEEVEGLIQKFEKQARATANPLVMKLKPASTGEIVTVRSILAFYEDKTPLQAEKLIQPFKGKWVESSGTIVNILPDGRPNYSVAVLKDGNDIVECRFDPQWVEKIAAYSKGDFLKYRGKISDNQNGSQLYLVDCELRS